MNSVFIDYSTSSQGFVDRLKDDLLRGGFEILSGLPEKGSETLAQAKAAAIEKAAFILLILSKDYADSANYRNRRRPVLERDKRRETTMIPLKVDSCEVPDDLRYKADAVVDFTDLATYDDTLRSLLTQMSVAPHDEPSTDETDHQTDEAMKRVFLSYNHNDKEVAARLTQALEAEGIAVTIDSKMAAGGDIEDFIIQSIKDTDVTLSVVSNKSLLSAWVAMESISTLNSEKFGDGKKFIACYIDDDFFEDDFALGAADIIDEELKKLKQTLDKLNKRNLGTKHLDKKKSRLLDSRNNLDDILVRLRDSLTLSIQDDDFDESVARIVDTIKGANAQPASAQAAATNPAGPAPV